MTQTSTDQEPHRLLRRKAQENPDFGPAVLKWCEQGYLHARKQLAAIGFRVSLQNLRNFRRWWGMRTDFASAEKQTVVYERQLRETFPDAAEKDLKSSGQEYFEQLAMERGNAKEFCELQYLRLAKLTEERKARQDQEKITLDARKISLLEEKERRLREKKTRKSGGLAPETLSEIEEAAKLL